MDFLAILLDVVKQPALIVGIFSFIGLMALRKPFHKVLTGTLRPVLGYIMMMAGSNIIVANLEPLGDMIHEGFHITGVVPSNEAIVASASRLLGTETMFILVAGLMMNLLIARFTRFKYVFLTVHHSFFMACLLSAVLGTIGLSGIELVLAGGFLLGAWSSISPAIGQKYTNHVTHGDHIALGHFGSLAYYISAWVGSKVGRAGDNIEDMEIPEKWAFLKDTTVSTAMTMVVFFLLAAFAAGSDYVSTISKGMSPVIFAIMSGLEFAVGVAVVSAGINMMLGDLIPAFKGVSEKVIPSAVPAVDCVAFFNYAPTAVVLGFVSSFIGGVLGMLILGFAGGVLIVPGLVAHFFCGAAAGIFGNATGGRRGAAAGAFTNGLLITFAAALLIPVFEGLGFKNTTFGDFDFNVVGMVLSMAYKFLGTYGIYGVIAVVLVVLVAPNFMNLKNRVINQVEEMDEEKERAED